MQKTTPSATQTGSPSVDLPERVLEPDIFGIST